MPQTSESITPASITSQFLSGGGEMGALTREFDWSSTSVGSIETWPQSLRITVGILINSKFPMFLFWGEELLCFYNDAYRPSLGNDGKHPLALGQPAAGVWPEIWSDIKPLIDQVLSGGDSVWSENQLLPIFRNGKLEDVYWTFSYSPVIAESGKPEGVFITCTETTETVYNLQRLQISDLRFQNLVREATVGIIVLAGTEMRVDLVNEMYGQLINCTPNELLNKKLFDIIPDAEPFFRPLLNNVLETGEPLYLYDTKYAITVKGKKIEGFLNVVYQPYRENDGRISGVMAICHDVTQAVNDRRQKEEIERRFRSLIEESPVASCLWIGPKFITEIANETMIRYWGKGDTVVGKPLIEALPELRDQPYFKILQQVYRSGSAHEEKNAEVLLVMDGKPEIFYFDYTYKPLFDDGQVYGIMNVAIDVTEKVLAQQKLQKSEQNLRNIFKQAPVAMALMKGPTFIVEIANEKTLEFWGKTSEETIGKPIFEVRHEAKGQGFEEILTNVYESGQTYSEYGARVPVIRNGKTETVYISLTYEPYRDFDGKISGVMAVFAEVTEEVLSRRKIEESELRFRNLIAVAPVGICVFTGRELMIETANRPFIDIVGKGPDIIGKTLPAVMPELLSENQPFLQILDNVYTSAKMFQAFGTRAKVLKNGVMTDNYYDITFTPLFDPDGNVYAILDISIDVTEKILSQQKIEESEKNLRNTIFQAPVAMCILKGEQHIVEIANELMLKLWGKAAIDMIDNPLFQALPEVRDQGFEILLDHVFKSGETVKAYEVPVTLPRETGIVTIYIDFVYEAFRESEDIISGVMVVAIDATEQVLARKRIEQAEESARLAIESADLGAYEVDLKNEEIITSERFNIIWGSDQNLTRENLTEAIHPDDREVRLNAHREALKTGNLQYEARIIWKDKSQHWVKIMGRVIYDDKDMPVTLLGIIQDITEQKEFAEQLTKQVNERTAELNRSNEDLLQFAHVASHDLKEPVRKTMVFTNLLENQYGALLPPEGKTYLKKIQNASERMFSMIEGVLAYSTLTSSEMPIEKVNLNDIINSIESDLEVLVKQKNCTIKRQELPMIEGASVLLYQLFYNLINNALKFAKENVNSEISIFYSEIKTNDGSFAEIVFADNGIGFNQEYAAKIFDAFSRLNAKDKYEGTGLGLALCKKIVERHHGSISASGIKNEGAIFTIMLPIKQSKKNI